MANVSVAQVKSFWNNQAKAGAKGLKMLVGIFGDVAKDRNWDGLATFYALAGTERPTINRLIRAAFGDKLTVAKDAKHPSGFRFKLGWNADEQFVMPNSFGILQAAVDAGKSFRALDLHNELKEVLKEPKGEASPVAEYAKSAYKLLVKNAKERGVTIDLIMAEIANIAKAEKAKG